jgi:DNA polymerase-3 subunit delta'
MSWNSIINQKRVKELLLATLEHKRLAHAYVFSGPKGIGKDATAIELAKVLNCETGTFEACGRCGSCVKVSRLQHPNVNLIFALPTGKGEKLGDGPIAKLSEDEITSIQQQLEAKAANPYCKMNIPKATGIKINSIREIRKESTLTVFGTGKKVFIILDAENLNDQSSNALLKTLEEPHEDTLLILTTSQPDALLPTIISRCQQIRFDLLGNEEIKQALQERKGIGALQAELIARLANGSYYRALELTDATLNERRSDAINFLRTTLYKTRRDLLQEIERISSEYQKSDVEEFLLMLQVWLHAAMVKNEGYDSTEGLADGEAIHKFVAHHPDLDYSTLFLSTSKAISLLDKNVYISLILLNLALELRRIILPSSKVNEEKSPNSISSREKGIS